MAFPIRSNSLSSFLAVVIRMCRHLTGRSLTPTTVRTMHRIVGDKSPLERLLNSRVEDGADADEIEFPAASWDIPIVSSDPFLHRLCVQSCEEVLTRRGSSPSALRTKVENTIAALLPLEQARHDLVAAKLGMSPRTLARRLSAEDLSFAGILTDMRSALAARYLANRALSISEIASLLGYAEVGTFTRAFQRWTGIAPSAARLSQRRSIRR